jgi:hypothetical protein
MFFPGENASHFHGPFLSGIFYIGIPRFAKYQNK